ncbi:hypothetical protein IM792_13830 [Mucilaginibacter sp. JRF]|uniref:hypothetical protein n=1 Tax=Mucilaginibacter sp. JRF TaxID=2780088 RepID=UPI00187FDF7A|nr:hypothetical protein [Mucilaginibacter sp. JRF]MBE9585530.1 hypothetical protein [Mucilaginibacter sp. JRF]
MIRTLLKPDNQNISIRLPENFVGKQVEVIAFTVEETQQNEIATDKPLAHFASQNVLAKDWLSAEEDEAWQDL